MVLQNIQFKFRKGSLTSWNLPLHSFPYQEIKLSLKYFSSVYVYEYRTMTLQQNGKNFSFSSRIHSLNTLNVFLLLSNWINITKMLPETLQFIVK